MVLRLGGSQLGRSTYVDGPVAPVAQAAIRAYGDEKRLSDEMWESQRQNCGQSDLQSMWVWAWRIFPSFLELKDSR